MCKWIDVIIEKIETNELYFHMRSLNLFSDLVHIACHIMRVVHVYLNHKEGPKTGLMTTVKS